LEANVTTHKTDLLKLPPPLGLCPECLRPPVAIAYNETLLAVYCEHNAAGGLMPVLGGVASGRWTLFTPVSAAEFADRVAKIMDGARDLSMSVNAADRRLN
jgi:hypothetical protein